MATIRTERAEVLWAAESTFGVQAAGTYQRFGIHDTIDVPDPEFGWEPFFGVFSQRDRATILRGPASFRGSVPDIRLLGGLTTFLSGHVIGTPVAPSLVSPFTLYVSYRDTDNSKQLNRYFIGGKVNRATLSAVEGQELRLGVDEMLFLRNLNFRSGNDPGYSGGADVATDPGASATGRFMFAQGSLTIAGVTFPRLRRFSLSVDNQIETRYYIQRDATTGLLHPNDLIEGRRTWRLDVDVDIVNPASGGDLELWDFLMNQGATGAGNAGMTVGGQVVLQFNQAGMGEGSTVLTLTCGGNPSTTQPSGVLASAPHNLPAPPVGVVTVTGAFDIDRTTLAIS